MNDRIKKVLENMQEAQLDQILVSAPSSLRYLVGLSIAPGERLAALVLRSDGKATMYGNRLFTLPESPDYELVEFDDTQDSVEVLEKGIRPGKLGIDKVWPGGFAVRLMDQRPDVKLTLGSDCVDLTRMIKSPEEIEKMRRSSLLNDKVTERTIRSLHAGMTEMNVYNNYDAFAKEAGAEGCSFEPLICFGPNAAEPHHESNDTVVKHGDAAIFDVGLLLDHYCSDMTRTCFFGEMTDEQKKVHDIVREANRAGREKAGPGVPLSEIDKAARDVIVKAGYGEYFLHRTGHGIGQEVHEPPDVSATNKLIARPGMVFSVEPGIYLKGKFGVRVEDLVAITENGAITLNELSREPIVIKD